MFTGAHRSAALVLAFASAFASAARADEDVDLAPLAPLTPAPLKKQPKPARPSRPREPKSQERIVLRGPSGALKPGQTANISIKVYDEGGNPVIRDVSLTVDEGDLGSPSRGAGSELSASYTAPANARAGGSAIIRAEVRGGSRPISAHLTVFFEAPRPKYRAVKAQDAAPAGAAARIVFPGRVEARPDSVTKVYFRLEDGEGRLAPADRLVLRCEAGTFENLAKVDDGYLVEFVPDDGRQGEFAIYADTGGGSDLAGEGTLIIEATRELPAGPSAGVHLMAFLGGQFRSDTLRTSPQIEFAGEMEILRDIRAGLMLGYAPASAPNVRSVDGALTADFSMSVFSLLARGAWTYELAPVLDVYAGGLVGISLVSATLRKPEELSFLQTVFDRGVFAGASTWVGPGKGLVELRFRNMPLERKRDPEIKRSYLGGLSLQLGYEFVL